MAQVQRLHLMIQILRRPPPPVLETSFTQIHSKMIEYIIQLKQYPIIDFSIGLTIVEKASIGLNFSSIKRTQEYIKKEKSSARKERLLSVIHFIIFLSCLSYLLYKW